MTPTPPDIAPELIPILQFGSRRSVSGLRGRYANLSRPRSALFRYFSQYPYWIAGMAPCFFRRRHSLGPETRPGRQRERNSQVIEAIERAEEVDGAEKGQLWSSSLVSIRTALVKVVFDSVGIMGGASIGREGPTVQIASSDSPGSEEIQQNAPRYHQSGNFSHRRGRGR